jgi:hypothetical protein
MRARSQQLLAWLATGLGPDERGIAVGLVLLTAGLWSFFGAGALVAPGVVVLWDSVPPRAAWIIHRTPEPETPTKRRTA